MKITVHKDGLVCPKCGAPELRSPTELNIRGFKVADDAGNWWSQCLVCAGYDHDASVIREQRGNVSYIIQQGGPNFDPTKGWFK